MDLHCVKITLRLLEKYFYLYYVNFKIDGFKIVYSNSAYFLPSIFKIFPPVILSKLLKYWKPIDKKLSKIFKNKGQFLIIEMVKEQ